MGQTPARDETRPVRGTRRRLFLELLSWMVGLGLLAGLVFPPFVVLLGVAESLAFKPSFYIACLTAGLAVGGINFLVACRIVRPRLMTLSEGMRRFRIALQEDNGPVSAPGQGAQTFHVPVDSADELGKAAESFNRLIDALVRARRTEDAVRDFSQTLASQLDLAPLCREALSVMLARTGAVGGALLVYQEDTLECAAAYGMSNPGGLTQRADVLQALGDLKARQVESPGDVLLTGGPEVYPRELLLLPVEAKGEPLGILVLASLTAFTPEIFRLLDFFRQSLKLALQNALSHERLGRIAAMDSLTGCYNRRMGMERLGEEFSRVMRGGESLGVAMFDIDHFKPVNDTWGHLAGDRILVQTARAVQQELRESDVLVRYGGEEFLVLLPGTQLAEARQVAERVRKAVSSMEISGEGPEGITVSIGVGTTATAGVTQPDELLQLVDEALYRAKSAGRDRVAVVSAEELRA
ncbi:MAG: diguanylate cyclase [Thioalkalivibrio sp.]